MTSPTDRPADQDRTVLDLPIEAIRDSRANPRQFYDELALAELAQSIRVKGVLVPLLVRPLTDGCYELIAGARRLRAAQRVGLSTLPCLVRSTSDQEAREEAVTENLQREQVPPLDEAAALAQLVADGGVGAVRDIAARLGKSPGYVWDRVRLLHLIPEAQGLLLAGRLPVAHAVRLARLTPEQQALAIHPDRGGVFAHEERLWRDVEEAEETADPYVRLKARSVREVEAWIAEHVRFDVSQAATAAPLDFGPVAESVEAARSQPGRGRKVISITYDSFVKPDARAEERTYCQTSWKRADGQEGSQVCDRSLLGVIVVGPDYGQAFPVCIHKECDVHWKAERVAREKRVRALEARGHSGETASRKADEEAQRRGEAQRAKSEQARTSFQAARPAIMRALVAAVKTAKAGVLKDLVLRTDEWDRQTGRASLAALGTPKTADQILRVAALQKLFSELSQSYSAVHTLPRLAKPLGVDVVGIVKAHATKHPPAGLKTTAGAEAHDDDVA